MCDRCEVDMLLYGEAGRCEAPVWEKGRFQAEPVEDRKSRPESDKPAPDPEKQKPGREQE